MDEKKLKYKVLEDEFHGLVILAIKGDKNLKLYVSSDLLYRNNITFWQDAACYRDFIDKHIEFFIENIERGSCRKIADGFLIE